MIVQTLEQCWEMVLRSAYGRCRFWQKKKPSFQMKLILMLAGIRTSKIVAFWSTENPHAYIEKPTHSKRVTVRWGYWSRDIIGSFFFENELGEAIAVNDDRVIGPCWRNFCSQKLKWRILTIFGFNRTALRDTQPKLHLMFYALFLKIAVSAAELLSFGYLESCDLTPLDYYLWGTVKDKCYTVQPKTIDALKDNICEATQSIMCLTIGPIM